MMDTPLNLALNVAKLGSTNLSRQKLAPFIKSRAILHSLMTRVSSDSNKLSCHVSQMNFKTYYLRDAYQYKIKPMCLG